MINLRSHTVQCKKLALLDFAKARLHQRHLQVVAAVRFYDIVIR